MSIVLRTTFPDGTDNQLLNQLGQVSAWKHTITFPGGCTAASFDYYADPQLNDPSVQAGRFLYAYQGAALIWSGRIQQPVKGTPWQIQCVGNAAMAQDHIVGTSLVTNTIVDASIANGLPWTRPASLTNPNTPASGDVPPVPYTSTLDDTLGLIVTQGIAQWYVTPQGVVSTPAAAATTPNYLLYCQEWPGQTQQSFATAVTGTYVSGGSTLIVQVHASAAIIARYGWVEVAYDTGTTSSSAATTAATAYLATVNLPTWSGPFTVNYGLLVTASGGTPVDPAFVQPGCMIRVVALQTGDSYGVSAVNVPIGQVDYDDDAGTADLTPLNAVRDDFESLLAFALSGP